MNRPTQQGVNAAVSGLTDTIGSLIVVENNWWGDPGGPGGVYSGIRNRHSPLENGNEGAKILGRALDRMVLNSGYGLGSPR